MLGEATPDRFSKGLNVAAGMASTGHRNGEKITRLLVAAMGVKSGICGQWCVQGGNPVMVVQIDLDVPQAATGIDLAETPCESVGRWAARLLTTRFVGRLTA